MHYINYTPGSIAFISSHPSLDPRIQIASTDVNYLSRIVNNFNDYLKWRLKNYPSIDFSSLTTELHSLLS